METELDEEEFKKMVCSFVRHWEKKKQNSLNISRKKMW